MQYVALIRGINVGQAKRVAMADLRAAVLGMGYRHVRTLLNSGNLLLAADDIDTDRVRLDVERALLEGSGVTANVVVLAEDEFRAIADANPLLTAADNLSRLVVGFVQSAPDAARLQPLLEQDWRPELLALGERAMYAWCANGIAVSALMKAVDALAGDRITARNAATVAKIAALLDDASSLP